MSTPPSSGSLRAGAPSSPQLRDALRTARVLATDVVRHFVGLALQGSGPVLSTTSAQGLRAAKSAFAPTLQRFGVELEVLHAERVPADGGLVLLWNQESHLDHLVLVTAIPRPFFSLFNNELGRVPFYGAHLRAAGHVHVDRTDESQWRPAVARAAERVRDGECVLVSPEGTRSRDGQLLPMKRGAFLLAAASTRPLQCVTVVGGHRRLPRGSPVVRPGPARVVFSELIPNDGDPTGLAERVAATFRETKEAFAVER